MPVIGRPETSNSKFGGITMRQAPLSKQDIIEKIQGKKATSGNVKFVDKKKHNVMGKDEFLKLLTHQLENQDPMNPMDQKKFSADLAQFAQLEQLANINSKMDKTGQNASTQNRFYAASFLGKKVFTKGSSIDLKGMPADVHFNLDKPAKEVLIRMYDSKGALVSEVKGGTHSKGAQVVSWDGRQFDGHPAADGSYRAEVRAWDDMFNEMKVETKSSGVVKAVSFEGNETVLTLMDDKKVLLKDVERFEVPNVASNKPKQVAINNNMAQQVKNYSQGQELTEY